MFQELPADDESPPETGFSARTKMRETEAALRSRLRFLQIARMEGWEVALQYINAKEGATDDPILVEARRRAVQGKREREKDRDQSETPAKKKNARSGRSGSGRSFPGVTSQPFTSNDWNFQQFGPKMTSGLGYDAGVNQGPLITFGVGQSTQQWPAFASHPFYSNPTWQSRSTAQPPLPPTMLPTPPPPRCYPAATMTGDFRCFQCGEFGHRQRFCPGKDTTKK